jgi:hypothetical protein
MIMHKKTITLVTLAGAVILSGCGTNNGPDNRNGNAESLPNVLIRNLDVYRLVGDEEYVKVPISEDIKGNDAQKFFKGDTDKITFDVATYYRNGSVYYKVVASLSRNAEGQIIPADFEALKSAVEKTSGVSFRLGFTTGEDAGAVFMPIAAINVVPSNFTRIADGKNARGKALSRFEYTGIVQDVPPSMFKNISEIDVIWSDAGTPFKPEPVAEAAVPQAEAASAYATEWPYGDPAGAVDAGDAAAAAGAAARAAAAAAAAASDY